MKELIEKFEQAIKTQCKVVHQESTLNSEGEQSSYYVVSEGALGLVIVDQHPIESQITAAVFIKNDQQRVKNALILKRPIPENTHSHILYYFRIRQNEDGSFKLYKMDDTGYKVNSLKQLVDTVVGRLTMEIKKHINETNRSLDSNN